VVSESVGREFLKRGKDNSKTLEEADTFLVELDWLKRVESRLPMAI